jgi:hypothetical protein
LGRSESNPDSSYGPVLNQIPQELNIGQVRIEPLSIAALILLNI